jgi:hypothetical protein
MCVLYLSQVAKAARDVGIEDADLAAEILRMVVELQSNESIYCTLLDTYGPERVNGGLKRKINWLIQSFIVHNYFDEFMKFCDRNAISIFNEDLDTDKAFASNARMVFIVFLREVVRLKSPVRFGDDRSGNAGE